MSVADVALSPILEDSARSRGGCYFDNNPSGHCSNESILIYLTVAGSLIPMRVLESDSIASVKLRIQTCNKGFLMKKQKLVYGGRELSRNDSLVKEYGVACGDVLHLVLKLSDLVLITVKTTCGREFVFYVNRHRDVGYLKKHIAKNGQYGKYFVNVDEQELFINGEKLDDQRTIDNFSYDSDAVINLIVQKSAKLRTKSFERDVELFIVADNESRKSNDHLHLVGFKKYVEQDFLLEPMIVNPKVKLPYVAMEMIHSISKGLQRGKPPVRSSEGTGGTYFMPDSEGNKYIGVFKPIDEEPMAINNPQGLPLSTNGEGLKKGTRVGEGALREVAAYILDHPRNGPRSLGNEEVGFAGVPPTVMVQCLHKGFNHPQGFDCSKKNFKVGSLQMFMTNFGSCEDLGPRDFPVEEVHKISVFDIRTANADRHAGNILASKENGCIVLTPIDNGYCLPESFEDCTFDWLYWPQAQEPYSTKTIEYIRSLEAEQDIELLKFYGWDLSVECSRTLRISTMLLKKGVERGFTPFKIGSIMFREKLNKESLIEEIVNEAWDSILPGMSEAAFIETVSKIMDFRLDMLVK